MTLRRARAILGLDARAAYDTARAKWRSEMAEARKRGNNERAVLLSDVNQALKKQRHCIDCGLPCQGVRCRVHALLAWSGRKLLWIKKPRKGTRPSLLDDCACGGKKLKSAKQCTKCYNAQRRAESQRKYYTCRCGGKKHRDAILCYDCRYRWTSRRHLDEVLTMIANGRRFIEITKHFGVHHTSTQRWVNKLEEEAGRAGIAHLTRLAIRRGLIRA